MNISLQIFFIACLTFFFSLITSSCYRSEDSTTETVVSNADGTSLEITKRCGFAETNPLQNSVESDNQTQKAFRLLLQTTFGPQKIDLDRIVQIGETSWIDEQLNLTSAYDVNGDNLTTNLEHYKTIAVMAEPSTYSDNTSFNNNYHGRTSDYQTAAWFEKALHAPDQLRYRVAFALSELLVVSGAKQFPNSDQLLRLKETIKKKKPRLPLEEFKYKLAQKQYNQLIGNRIKRDLMFFRHKNRQQAREELKARLRLQINQSGKVIDRMLIKTSGSSIFDKIVLDTVDLLELPPPMELLIREPPYVVTILIQP